ncbi:MAG: efflux RND transporter periplasmic adaptor subunit [Nitrospirae bacterium]|nr:efflux RND transporter periplasmic adaptor subunit [Nitrospirota bacterium]
MKIPITLQRQVWFAAFGILLVVAFGWVATKSGPLAPTRVTIVQVTKGDVSPALFGIGTVDARRTYLIGPTAAGRVKQVLVDVGDTVKHGQLLAEMETVDLNDRVASAVAAYNRAGSAVEAAEAQVNDAKSRKELADIEERRYIDLGQKDIVSRSTVEGKVQQKRSADALLASAEAALAGARKELARLTAESEGVRQQRQNINMVSPADGVVISRYAEPGSTVVAGQAVLKLVQPAGLWITVRLDQGRSAGLRVGLPASITLRSNPGKAFKGRVVRIEPISDSVTEERIAEVAFDSLPQGVSIGEMAEVTLHLPVINNAIILPNAGLHHQGGQTGVWLYKDAHIRFVQVETGAEGLDGKVQIVGGLQAGDEVIIYSDREIREDSRIKVVSSLGGKTK